MGGDLYSLCFRNREGKLPRIDIGYFPASSPPLPFRALVCKKLSMSYKLFKAFRAAGLHSSPTSARNHPLLPMSRVLTSPAFPRSTPAESISNSAATVKPRLQTTYYDDAVHHPLGAASYVFKKNLIPYLSQCCEHDTIKLRIGTQPNSSPHIGNIITFTTAFAIGKRLQEFVTAAKKTVLVRVEFINSAPSTKDTSVIDGVTFQKSLGYTGEMSAYMNEFIAVLEALSAKSGVKYEVKTQREFMAQDGISDIVRNIVDSREELSMAYASGGGYGGSSRKNFGIRSACPKPGCGLADKHGKRTKYEGARITFYCPHHGEYTLFMDRPEDVGRLELNTPLRTLLRTEYYTRDPSNSWIQVTGADYAGFYQEQLLWKHITMPQSVVIFYAPMVVDWAGSKLSKSLYVKENAYEYLKNLGMEYLVNFTSFSRQGRDLEVVFSEVLDWVDHPYKLFRAYSIEYLHRQFIKKEKEAQVTNRMFTGPGGL